MSEHRHWSDDALLDHLYGLTGRAEDVERCPECRARLTGFEQKRVVVAAPLEVPAEFLAAQRRRIYDRIERQEDRRLRWAPLAAAAALLAAGFFVYHPRDRKPSGPDASDAQFFADTYSMEQTSEPIAAEPIRALFEEGGGK